MGIGSALIGAAASIGGSILGANSAREANAANIAASREQMAFQERMRRTQYQTAVRDLRAAGLNPMLAYSQGGAGTPSGAMAVSRPEFEGGSGAGAVGSALAAVQLDNQARITDAQVKNTNADTVVKLADADRVGAQTALFRETAGLTSAQRNTESYRPQLLVEQARQSGANADLIHNTMFDTLAKIRADTALSRASAADVNRKSYIKKLLIDRYGDSFLGKTGIGLMEFFQ